MNSKIAKIAGAIVGMMSGVLLYGAGSFDGWGPTAGDFKRAHPDAISIGKDQMVLKGIPEKEWILFRVAPTETQGKKQVSIVFKAFGKGKVSVGFFGYRKGFAFVGQDASEIELKDKAAEYKLNLPVRAGMNLVRPKIHVKPNAEITITDFRLEVNDASVK